MTQGINPRTYTNTITPNALYNPTTVTGIVVENDKVTTVPPVTLMLK
ncbi:hypothetical protein [Algoriphagus sp.]